MLAVLAVGLAGAAGPGTAQGQQDGAALLAAGAKALDAKQYTSAVSQLSKAMRAEGMSTQQIAKALLMRGVAQQGAGKPAHAIADLNGALWLQGLSNKDLAQAYINRGQAYQSVGMDDRASADLRRARDIDPNSTAVAAPPRDGSPQASVNAFDTRVETAARSPEAAPVPGFQTEVRTAAREPDPVPAFRTSILPDEQEKKAPRPATAASPSWSTSVAADQRKAAAADAEDKPKGAVGGFFSSLWKSATGKDDEDAQPASEADKQPAPSPAASDWGQRTTVASREQAAAPAPSNATADGRGYRVQLAAVRSQQEADATWQRLAARHQQLLAGRSPVIEKTEVGSLGTFYRIQIGPLPDKKTAAQLCNDFKAGGVDCFLVAR